MTTTWQHTLMTLSCTEACGLARLSPLKASFPSDPRAAPEPWKLHTHLPYKTMRKLPWKGQRVLPACSSPPPSIRMCRVRRTMVSSWSLMTSLPEEQDRERTMSDRGTAEGRAGALSPPLILEGKTRTAHVLPCTPCSHVCAFLFSLPQNM